jgi:hypothetical protein
VLFRGSLTAAWAHINVEGDPDEEEEEEQEDEEERKGGWTTIIQNEC